MSSAFSVPCGYTDFYTTTDKGDSKIKFERTRGRKEDPNSKKEQQEA